jgi:hypothetical protein
VAFETEPVIPAAGDSIADIRARLEAVEAELQGSKRPSATCESKPQGATIRETYRLPSLLRGAILIYGSPGRPHRPHRTQARRAAATPVSTTVVLRRFRALLGERGRRYLPLMRTADIEYWTARVAELRELDAETKLGKVNLIAAELMRTREALKEAKAKLGRAGLHPRHGKLAPRVRHSANNVAATAGNSIWPHCASATGRSSRSSACRVVYQRVKQKRENTRRVFDLL